MDLLEELFGSDFLRCESRERKYSVLCDRLEEEDMQGACRELDALEEPLDGRFASNALRLALYGTPELFRRVLDHCAPGEYADNAGEKKGDGSVTVQGSILLLAALLDRPEHAAALLERGWDCNGAGLEIASNLRNQDGPWGDEYNPYFRYSAATGNRLEWYVPGCPNRAILQATPLAAALLCGSVRTARVLLNWPGVWKGESSAVCRAAALVLETPALDGERKLLREQQMEVLRQIFSPEREDMTDEEEVLRKVNLQPAAWADFCRVRTLQKQLESGLCSEWDARGILCALKKPGMWPHEKLDRRTAGKLLLLKRYFPRLCREPQITGRFLQEILQRCAEKLPYKALLKGWKALCGPERDLTPGGNCLWALSWRELRTVLGELGEGGILVMDADAVTHWTVQRRWMQEIMDRVELRFTGKHLLSNFTKHLCRMGDLKLLLRAAQKGLLAREEPGLLLSFLQELGQAGAVRAAVLTYASPAGGPLPARELPPPAQWEYLQSGPCCEAENETALAELLQGGLGEETCLERLYQVHLDLLSDFFSRDQEMKDREFPALTTNSLLGIACCAQDDMVLRCLQNHLPHFVQKPVTAQFGQNFFFRGTPLCLAAALGREEQVRLLLEQGIHPDEVGQGDVSRFVNRSKDFSEEVLPVTAVLAALLFGQEGTARILLEAGALCDLTCPAHRRVLEWSDGAGLALAQRLHGIGFERLGKRELDILKFTTAGKGERATFWCRLRGDLSQ